MTKARIGFYTSPLRAYQLNPSEDGEWLGVILTLSDGMEVSFALPATEAIPLASRLADASDVLRARKLHRLLPHP